VAFLLLVGVATNLSYREWESVGQAGSGLALSGPLALGCVSGKQ
jgi:hypothetical protein